MRSTLPRRALALLAMLATLLPSPINGQEEGSRANGSPADSDTARAAALELRYAISERQRAVESVRHAEAEQALQAQIANARRSSALAVAIVVALAAWLLLRQRQSQGELAEELQTTDPLTGLRNRRYVQQLMPAEVSGISRRHRVAPPGHPPADSDLVFFVIDVDRFRRINDAHGHAAGDRVLAQVARQLTTTLRDSDLVAR